MTPRRPDMTQFASNGMALVLTAGVLVVWFATKPDSWREALVQPANAGHASIEISLQQAAEAPPAPPPPVRRKMPEHRVVPRHDAVAEIPVPTEPESAPQHEVPEGAALVASSSAAASAQPRDDSHADLEAQYAAGLRADIDRRTHPPDSVQYRLRRPSGEVRVGFVLMRSGEPKTVHVLRSSGSSMLDEAAVAIVSSGHYPPMPTLAFAGQSEHVFAVTIEFRAPS
jgi:TonB family protein